MGGHAARMENMTNSWNVLVGKLQEKIPLERPRRRWLNNMRKNKT